MQTCLLSRDNLVKKEARVFPKQWQLPGMREEIIKGRIEMQCGKTMVGISSATYFVLSFSCPFQTDSQTQKNLHLLADLQPNQIRSCQQKNNCFYVCVCFFLYILGVQNLKHSEATFALFFFFLLFLTLSDSFLLVAVSLIVATRCNATSLH